MFAKVVCDWLIMIYRNLSWLDACATAECKCVLLEGIPWIEKVISPTSMQSPVPDNAISNVDFPII